MGVNLFAAFSLMLVFEGVLPFFAPTAWRQALSRMVELSNGQLRFMGLISMLGGIVLLYLLR